MMMHLVTIPLKIFNTVTNLADTEALQHLRTEYFVRFIFFFLCCALILTALLLTIRQKSKRVKSFNTAEFSMIRDVQIRFKREFFMFTVLLLFVIILVMIFQATMFILLQIDLWLGLPIKQISGTPKQIVDTLAGRLVLLNHSIFLDRERLLSLLDLNNDQYMIQYLQTSHLIVYVKPLP